MGRGRAAARVSLSGGEVGDLRAWDKRRCAKGFQIRTLPNFAPGWAKSLCAGIQTPCIRFRGVLCFLYGALKTPIQRPPLPSDSRFFCALRFLPGAWLIQYRFVREYVTPSVCGFKAPGAHHWMRRQPLAPRGEDCDYKQPNRHPCRRKRARGLRRATHSVHVVIVATKVVSEALDCDKVPNELAPAAYVLGETAKDAEQLWDDAESWYMDYDHTPRESMSAAEELIEDVSNVPVARIEASLDDQTVQFVRMVSSMSARGRAVLTRLMTHLKNQPPGAGPVPKEQVAGWLREEGASDNEVSWYLKEMEAVERSQAQP